MTTSLIRINAISETPNFELSLVSDVSAPWNSRNFDPVELAKSDHLFYNILRRSRNTMASLRESEVDRHSLQQYRKHLKEAGEKLHNTFLSQVNLDRSRERNISLGQFNLSIDPVLWGFSWELLHDSKLFLEGMDKPIVRWVDGYSDPQNVVYLTQPQILFLGADPIDHATRAPEQWEKIISTIPNYIDAEKILKKHDIGDKEKTTQWDSFTRKFIAHPPDILHIVSHGKINDDGNLEGFIFEGITRNTEITVGGEELVDLLVKAKRVKLLIIVACQSGRLFEEYPQLIHKLFSQTDLKSVIVMASDISAEAAIKFTEHFYETLWLGSNVANAVAAARHAIRSQKSKPISLQWSIPMLYESSSLNPYQQLSKVVHATIDVNPLELENLEVVQKEAREIHRELDRLMNLKQQVRPAPARIRFSYEKLQSIIEKYELAMEDINCRFPPADETLLHAIRVKSSIALAKIFDFLDEDIKWDRSGEAKAASYELVQRIDQSIHLLEIRNLGGF